VPELWTFGHIHTMPPIDAPSWKKLVKKAASDAEFAGPASDSQLAAVEQALGIQLPQDLRELLLEFDGVTANYGAGVVWSASEIQKQNQMFRSDEGFKELYMPFDHLLFLVRMVVETSLHSRFMQTGRFTSATYFVGSTNLTAAFGWPIV
jgi:cell wall assembly regulator SMI1